MCDLIAPTRTHSPPHPLAFVIRQSTTVMHETFTSKLRERKRNSDTQKRFCDSILTFPYKLIAPNNLANVAVLTPPLPPFSPFNFPQKKRIEKAGKKYPHGTIPGVTSRSGNGRKQKLLSFSNKSRREVPIYNRRRPPIEAC